MTVRHLLLGAGLCVAGWLAFFGDKTPAGGSVSEAAKPAAHASASRTSSALGEKASVVRTPAPQPSPTGERRDKTPSDREPVILTLRPRDVLIGGAHAETASDALFTSQSWTPPPPPPPPKPTAPPAPVAPPLPFTFVGKKSENGIWEVYLAHGEQTLVVREQSVIEDTYRVESIKPPTLSLTYLPLNQVQILTIGGTD